MIIIILQCVGCSFKYCAYINFYITLIFSNILITSNKVGNRITSFLQTNRSTQALNNLPKGAQLVRGGAEISTQAVHFFFF